MDRNTLIGLVLIFGILAGSFYLLQPSDQELKQEQLLQDSLKNIREGVTVAGDSLKASSDAQTLQLDSADLSKPFATTKIGQEQLITLENERVKVTISSKGGRIKSIALKGEQNFDGSPLVSFDGEDNKFGLAFKANGENVNTENLFFSPQGSNVTVSGEDSKSVSLKLAYNEGQYIEYIYTLKGNDYNVGFDVKAVGIQKIADLKQKSLVLNWQTTIPRKEVNISSEREKSTIFFKELNGNVDYLSETSDDQEQIAEKVQWIAFKQHFFSSVLTAKDGFANTELTTTYSTDPEVVKIYKATADLDFDAAKDNQYSFNFFFGPNQYKTLKAEGNDFDEIINMGWGPMGWINKYITVPIFDLLDGFKLSYGIIILLLTLFLKLVLFPLTYKSYKSMAMMRVLKPQLDEIKEKVGEDNPMLLQQEQMKLYKQVGVNPLGGCLPLLVQMPFTLAFFMFFPNLFELRGENFLWVEDLSTYDAFISFSPIFGVGHISLMCVLMTLTTLLTTWYNNATSGAANNQMKYIGYIMPLVFFFVLNSFPAGLNYYYCLAAIFTFLTQFIIRQFLDDNKILAQLEANKANPKAAKKSSFQQKMEDMMRAQQQQQKNKK